MSAPLRVTILGSGTSAGVPMIGCACAVCRSADPHDHRTRPSILMELPPGAAGTGPLSVLVDTSSDLRAQALALGLTRIDAILFTHSHADHVCGLDDVRRFNVLQKGMIPCFADAGTAADIRRMFSYVFAPHPGPGGGIPQIALFHVGGPFCLGRHEVVPVPLMHGRRSVLGYRVGDFAYLTDCNAISDDSFALVEGVRVLVLDGLRDRPHPTHFTVAEAIDAARRIGAEQTWLTHICHDLPHEATCARLPRGVQLAYDGLVLEV